MRFKTLSSLGLVLMLLVSLPVDAARQTREEMERNFQYGWSQAASMIFYGTIASVDYEDDPRMRSPHAEVLVRVDSVQRGVPGNSMVRIRIEDELQTYRWKGDVSRIGETGIWFVHRVRQFEGDAPRGYLIRYMDRQEMEEEPQFLAELMKYVVQDTVDQMIRPNILNLLSTSDVGSTNAVIKMDLSYDESGTLEDINVTEKSGNLLFNDHVFDTVLQIHRRIRVPGQVRKTSIQIEREML